MASRLWLKLPHALIHDASFMRLNSRLRLLVFDLVLVAADLEANGELPTIEAMAWTLHADPEELQADLETLAGLGYASHKNGRWIANAYLQWQGLESPQAERMRRLRARRKAKGDRHSDAAVTARDDSVTRGREQSREMEAGAEHLSPREAAHDSPLEAPTGKKTTVTVASPMGHSDRHGDGVVTVDQDQERDQDQEDGAESAPSRAAPHNSVLRTLEEHFAERTALAPPQADTAARKKGAAASWWQPLREIAELVDYREDDALALVDAALARLQSSQMTISCPRSILKTCQAIVAEAKRGAYRPEEEPKGYAGLRAYLASSEVLNGRSA